MLSPLTPAFSNHEPQIRVGYSAATSPSIAAAELRALVGHDRAGLLLVFFSGRYDRTALAQELKHQFGSLPMVGCTTGGEIGPSGYTDGGVSAIILGTDDFVFEASLIEHVSELDRREGQAIAYRLRQKLANRVPDFKSSRCFALLLIDGLCSHEEIVASAVQNGLGGIQMVGGSAGDGLKFEETAVLYEGRSYTDAAVLLVVATPHPFVTFKTQNFVSGEQKLVLTGAVPDKRLATEINGLPAAEEYARAIGVDLEMLSPVVFSAHPLIVRVGGADFVRSIQKVNPDRSITFFCAIDEGIVFNIASSIDMSENLRRLFDQIEQSIGCPRVVIGCDCILRRLELINNGAMNDISTIMRQHNVIGFSSYGEQFRGMHVNQTFTGIAVGVRGH